MRKTLHMVLALVLCAALICPALASEFVPSISEKPAPEIGTATGGTEDLTPCIVITTITEADEKSTDIHQESRDELLEVYEALASGTMKLPLEGDYVIRELVDVSFRATDCIEAGDKHDEWLEEENTSIEIVFKLQLAPETELIVMKYDDGAWETVPTTHNSDGTLTCIFDDFCPVAFCVPVEETQDPVHTGDTIGRELVLWVVLMVLSAVMIVVLLTRRRKEEQ